MVRFKILIFISAVVMLLFFGFFRYIFPKTFGIPTEKIGLTGRFTTESLPLNIQSEIGSGLTKINDDGTVEPDLALSWNTPDAGKTWVFELKDDLFWQDGESLESQDLSYEFSDVDVEFTDEKTITFKLDSAFGAFPSVVAKPIFKSGLLGTGDWEVEKLTVSGNYVQQLVLRHKNSNRKVYKFYPTEDRTKLALKLGEVGRIEGVFNTDPFDTWKTVEIEEKVDRNKIVAIFLNTSDPFLSEKSYRQALAYAIDKNNLGERAIGPLSPESWAYNPQVKTYDHDDERARELVEEIPEEVKQTFPLKLYTSPTLLSVAEGIARDWSEIGIETSPQVVSGIPPEYQAFLVIFDIPKDPDQYVLWHSTQTGTNISRYQNPRIDKLLEDGRLSVNIETRKSLYLDFQRFLLEDSPAIFLYHPKSYSVVRK